MKRTTLKELRAQAKARGLKGYSKLAKEELLRLLGEPRTPDASTRVSEPTSVATERGKSTTSPTTRTAHAFPAPTVAEVGARVNAREQRTPPRAMPAATIESRPASTEEWVEGAKYALRPNGKPAPQPGPDLGEDIDRLPALAEPMVCLLSQKPGVLHAYWLLPADVPERRKDYKLRLTRSGLETLHVYEEIPVQVERGTWYFHVPENAGGQEMAVQLGYYQDGKFVSAQGQSTARLPSLHASARTDHRWWVSEADFARMYAAGGGVVAGARRYEWAASIGSPSAAPGAPSSAPAEREERMAWPGGVSSRQG